MRRNAAAAVVVWVVLAIATAAPASAKGPSGGEISGPGVDVKVLPFGEGTPGGDQLIQEVGFFESTFGQVPSKVMADAPTSDLGPALSLRWTVPGPSGTDDTISQSLYPWAAGGPLVFTAPGQPFFDTERTVGGWYRAPASLVESLELLGIERPSGTGGGTAWAPIGATLAGMVLLGGVAIALAPRRRDDLAPAAT